MQRDDWTVECCFCECASNQCVILCEISEKPCSSYATEEECNQGESECFFDSDSGCCLQNLCSNSPEPETTTTEYITT